MVVIFCVLLWYFTNEIEDPTRTERIFVQWTLVTTTAFVPKEVAIIMNLLF